MPLSTRPFILYDNSLVEAWSLKPNVNVAFTQPRVVETLSFKPLMPELSVASHFCQCYIYFLTSSLFLPQLISYAWFSCLPFSHWSCSLLSGFQFNRNVFEVCNWWISRYCFDVAGIINLKPFWHGSKVDRCWQFSDIFQNSINSYYLRSEFYTF